MYQDPKIFLGYFFWSFSWEIPSHSVLYWLKSMKFTDIWGSKCKKSGYFKPVLSAAYSWDFQINKIWKRRSRTNTKSIYSHAGARMGLWWLILSRYFWKKKIEKKKKKNFFFFFFFFFKNFIDLATEYHPSETHAWPCVPIDGFGIGPWPLFSDFVDLKVPAICCR